MGLEHQELNEKLARWTGVKPFPIYPTGYDYPAFTESLSASFEWLVPKLLEEYNFQSYWFRQFDDWYYSETNIWKKGNTKHGLEILQDQHISKHFEQGTDLNKITALALCRAVEKLIDKE